MPSPAFRFLEYVFLALLYLFLLRVVRAVWVELREPRLIAAPPQGADLAGAHNTGVASAVPSGTANGRAPNRGQPVPLPKAGLRRGLPTKLTLVGGGPAKGTVFPLAEELTIGRAAGCAVTVADDTFVSQLHARVFFRGDGFWVEDLGSTNGTLLNGRKVIGSQALQKGDRLQVGQTVLELQR